MNFVVSRFSPSSDSASHKVSTCLLGRSKWATRRCDRPALHLPEPPAPLLCTAFPAQELHVGDGVTFGSYDLESKTSPSAGGIRIHCRAHHGFSVYLTLRPVGPPVFYPYFPPVAIPTPKGEPARKGIRSTRSPTKSSPSQGGKSISARSLARIPGLDDFLRLLGFQPHSGARSAG